MKILLLTLGLSCLIVGCGAEEGAAMKEQDVSEKSSRPDTTDEGTSDGGSDSGLDVAIANAAALADWSSAPLVTDDPSPCDASSAFLPFGSIRRESDGAVWFCTGETFSEDLSDSLCDGSLWAGVFTLTSPGGYGFIRLCDDPDDGFGKRRLSYIYEINSKRPAISEVSSLSLPIDNLPDDITTRNPGVTHAVKATSKEDPAKVIVSIGKSTNVLITLYKLN